MTQKNRIVRLAIAMAALMVVLGTLPAQENTESLNQATFIIEGMTCGGCVGAVKVQLKRTPGVKEYEVSHEKGEALVTYDLKVTDPEAIAASISKSGFKAAVKHG